MKSSVDTRLRKLEALRPYRIILETVIDGQARRLTAPEFVAGGYDFLKAKIVSGNCISDAQMLLDTIPSPGIQ